MDWQRLVFSSTQFSEGGGPSEDDRAALEERVLTDARDVEARVRLVGCYYGRLVPETQQRRAEHLAWLAEHRPDIGLGGFGSIIEEYAPAGYAATRKAWVAAESRPDAGVEILDNAASFLGSEFARGSREALSARGRDGARTGEVANERRPDADEAGR